MNKILYTSLRVIRKIYSYLRRTRKNKDCDCQDYSYVQLYDQQANDYVVDKLNSSKHPIMIFQFGTTELYLLSQYRIRSWGGGIKERI